MLQAYFTAALIWAVIATMTSAVLFWHLRETKKQIEDLEEQIADIGEAPAAGGPAEPWRHRVLS